MAVDLKKLNDILSNPLYNTKVPRVAPRQAVQTDSFADFLAARAYQTPRSQEFARASAEGSETEEPSWLSKFFEGLTAPLYGVYDAAVEVKEGDIHQLPETLAGTAGRIATGIDDTLIPGGKIVPDAVRDWSTEKVPQRYGHEFLDKMGVDNKYAKYGGGLAMDILADPLSYAGVGLASKAKRIFNPAEELGELAAKSSPPLSSIPETVAPAAIRKQPKPTSQDLLPGPIGPNAPRARGAINPATVAPKIEPTPVQVPENFGEIIANDADAMREVRKFTRSEQAKAAANTRHHGTPDPVAAEDGMRIENMMRHLKMESGKGKVTTKTGALNEFGVARAVERLASGEALPLSKRPPIPPPPEFREFAEGFAKDYAGSITSTFNPAKQANLYNSLFTRAQEMVILDRGKKVGLSKKGRSDARKLAIAMMRPAENAMIAAGKAPVAWNGQGIRLSDVFNEVNSKFLDDDYIPQVLDAFANKSGKKVKNPELRTIIENIGANRAINTVDVIANAERYALQVTKSIDEMPLQARQRYLSDFPKEMDKVAKQFGATKAEQAAIREAATKVRNNNLLPTETLYLNLGREVLKSAEAGKITSKQLSAVTNRIRKTVDATPKELRESITQAKAQSVFATNMTTWMGRGPMKIESDQLYSHAEKRARSYAQWAREQVKNHSEVEIANAFRVAQGVFPAAGRTEKELELSKKFQDYFENTLGSSRFTNVEDYLGTTAARSTMVMEDINKQLKTLGSFFQFSAKPDLKKPITGTPRDYSPLGDGWTASWELFDPTTHKQDPVAFMYNLDLAMERTLSKYALIDSFTTHFGARKGDAYFDAAIHTTKLKNSRTADTYFPKEQAEMFQRLLDDTDKYIWQPGSPAMKNIARAVSLWKKGVTIYIPSHHVRNMVGDVWMTWMAGHNDPRDYMRAMRVLGAYRQNYKNAIKSDDLTKVDAMFDRDSAAWLNTQGDDVVIKQGKHSITANQIYLEAQSRGLLLDARALEDIFEPLTTAAGRDKGRLQKMMRKPLGGKGHAVATGTSEIRDHYVRIAHFNAAIRKNLKKGKSQEQAFKDAAHEVRRWHPDGRDLTQFEQSTMRFIFPFYSWTRKSIPLMVESAVTRPAKVAAYPKAVMAAQGMMGVDTSGGILDPYPDDQLFPDWIRASGIGPIGDATSDDPAASWFGKLGRNVVNPFGTEQGYTVINPGNPLVDTAEGHLGQGTAKEFFGGLFGFMNPAIQIPAQLGMGRTGTGRPIFEGPGALGLDQYAVEQVPIVAPIQNTLELGRPQKENIDSSFDMQSLMNYLTAAGITGTSPYQTQASIEAGERKR